MSHSKTIAAVTCTLLNLIGPDTTATAQTLYPFDATYVVSSTSVPVAPGVSATTLFGESTDAPYGLDQVRGLTYSQVDLTTGSFRFNTDPARFGLPDLPPGEVALFGSSGNRLFGSNDATGAIDFTTLTGRATNIFTIVGGGGLFPNAVGSLTLAETYQISFDPAVPTTAIARATGTITVPATQEIPESDQAIALIGAVTMIGLLSRQRRRTRVEH